ncbi:MAG: serine/threonine-protein kinase PknK [Anaerolineae bacterium]|nr:serine/threonine-protein kinase PknK [Anaerolineae bacterium]
MTAIDLSGQKLGLYQIEAILGSGGIATVYRARNPQSEVVALKVLAPPPKAGREILARFEREARTAARLNHPGIVQVLDVGQAKGCAFMVMPLIEGQSLADRLTQVERLDETTAADIAWQVADALHYAHQQGVIHRDVKPSNILLASGGQALLTDFGVALALDDPVLTLAGHTVGTPVYMAPEQAAGVGTVDGRADLYSLGVVLYHMVTGLVPFQGNTPQILHAHVYQPPAAPSTITDVSPAMEVIILRALAKEVSERFQTGAAMAEALARLSHQPPTKTFVASIQSPRLKTPQLTEVVQPSGQASRIQNPFFYGGAVAPELFYGREEILKAIVNRVGGRTAQSISIVGERRMGKSSLLNYFRARADQLLPGGIKFIIIYLDLMKAYCHTWAGLMRVLRRELTSVWRQPWSASEDGDLVAFDFALEELQADGIRFLLCLDEIENLTQRAGEFNEVLEDWRACGSMGQMAMMTASAQPLADLCASSGLTSPFYNIFSQQWLGLLPAESWQALVTENMATTADDLAFIDKIAGGHPFFTQIAASHLWEAKTRDEVDYVQLREELWFQFQPHLQHLWRKLAADEQTILRRLATSDSMESDSIRLAALERRGLVRQYKPFSELFGQMIVGGHLDE